MSMLPIEPDFCRTCSVAVDEPIAGTAASSTWVWFVLECDAAWGPRGYDDAELPAQTRAALDAAEEQLSGVRIQLVRRPARNPGESKFLVGMSRPPRASLVEFSLPDPSAIASIDLVDVVARLDAGQPIVGARSVDEPMLLVCTHGKRDRCCAKWGLPVYNRAADRRELEVWQTTHLGGHRFAATLLVLPHGICYGRVELDEVDDLIAATRRGELYRLDRLRGRTCWSSAVQAAEAIVRAHTKVMAIDAVELLDEVEVDGVSRVTLRCAGQRFAIDVVREPTGKLAPGSCGKRAEPVYGHRGVALRPLGG